MQKCSALLDHVSKRLHIILYFISTGIESKDIYMHVDRMVTHLLLPMKLLHNFLYTDKSPCSTLLSSHTTANRHILLNQPIHHRHAPVLTYRGQHQLYKRLNS